uniref:ADP-ribosylglycohydrolase family protein n=1 Tax=Ignisphaera aggregans TaxID=334771 RepID=A0A7C5UUW6_9CREN
MHTIINVAIVTVALLHGYPGYEKAIALAVMSRFDTDCNGATVGSVNGWC